MDWHDESSQMASQQMKGQTEYGSAPLRLSLCMITKDEAANLPGALESVRGLVDEIIVVDTGSTDDTVRVAMQYGAKVYPFTWVDDFSAARNASIGRASGDWILVLDADERVSPESKAVIRRLIVEGQDDAYMCRILNSGIGKDALGRVQHYMTRLFRNIPCVRFHGRIHEQLIVPGGRVGTAHDIVIEHTGYSNEAILGKQKHERNRAFLERVVAENPEDLFARFNLGNHYYSFGDYENALAHLEVVCRCAPKNLNYVVSAYALAIESLIQLGRLDEAKGFSARAIEAFQGLTDIEYARGNVCLKAGDLNEAEERFRKIVTGRTREHTGVLDCTIKTWKAHKGLAIALLRQGRYAEAGAAFKEALAGSPGDAELEALVALSEAAQGNGEQAVAVARKVAGLPDAGDVAKGIASEVLANAGVRLGGSGNYGEALGLFNEAIAINPKHVLALHWLGKLAGKQGNLSEARRYFETALAQDPESVEIAEDLARVCLELGDYESALRIIAPLARKGTSVSAMLLHARMLMESGDIAGSLKEVIRVTAIDPECEEAYFLMALDFSALGKHFEAIEILLRLIELDPNNPNYLRVFAHIARKTGNLEAARDAEEYAGKIR